MNMRKRDYKSEVLDIIRTKDWNRARNSNDRNLYQYIKRHRDTDENCKIIWEHVNTQNRNYKSEVLEIVKTKNWDRAKCSNDRNLYEYIRRNKDTDENCRIVWDHISQPRDYKSEVLDIIKTKDWNRARQCNDVNLYQYIKRHRDTDENCMLIWKHIKPKDFYTIKDYLLYYFENGKPAMNNVLYRRFIREIKKGNQCCIDIKNLIIAAKDYQDTVALETLELIKKHLEEEEG